MKNKVISVITALCLIVSLITIVPDKADAATNVVYYWPTSCHKVSGNWGKESGHYYPYHYGIDIPAAGGSKVRASAAGTVYSSGLFNGYGYCVRIKHADGKVTLYGHLRKCAVKKGARVSRGTVVGYVGGTGYGGSKDYPDHLHFGIYKSTGSFAKEDGRPAKEISYNPVSYINYRNVIYSSNGGTGSPKAKSVKLNSTITLSKSVPTRTGYTFKGWATSAKGSVKYKPGNKCKVTDTVKFYAVWAANKWTVKYNKNGGSGTMANTTHTYGVKTYLRKNTFTREGFKFKYWYAYNASTGKWMYTNGSKCAWYTKDKQPSGYSLRYYSDGCYVVSTTPVNKDVIVLYAVWEKKPEVYPVKDVTYSYLGDGAMEFTWNDQNNNSSAYYIIRNNTDGLDYRTNSSDNSFTVSGLETGKVYSFSIMTVLDTSSETICSSSSPEISFIIE